LSFPELFYFYLDNISAEGDIHLARIPEESENNPSRIRLCSQEVAESQHRNPEGIPGPMAMQELQDDEISRVPEMPEPIHRGLDE
jgi:hypothetical protein